MPSKSFITLLLLGLILILAPYSQAQPAEQTVAEQDTIHNDRKPRLLDETDAQSSDSILDVSDPNAGNESITDLVGDLNDTWYDDAGFWNNSTDNLTDDENWTDWDLNYTDDGYNYTDDFNYTDDDYNYTDDGTLDYNGTYNDTFEDNQTYSLFGDMSDFFPFDLTEVNWDNEPTFSPGVNNKIKASIADLSDMFGDLMTTIKDKFQGLKWTDHGLQNKEGQIDLNGSKVRCPFGCQVCSTSDDSILCETCLDGFALDSSYVSCVKCNDVCLTCSGNSTSNCISCYPGWTLVQSANGLSKTCSKCNDTKCGECSDVATCTTCKNSFFVGEDEKCTTCIDNCRICSDNLTCNQCYEGYFVKSEDPTECKLCSSGCAICSDLTECLNCYPGFFLEGQNNTCQKCSENCWNCTSSNSCDTCVIGSLLVNNTCVSPIDFCAVLNPDGTCKQCYWGYKKSDNKTQCLASDSKNENNLQNKIKQIGCKIQQYLNGSKCQQCNATFANCQDCNSKKCLRCTKGYLVSSDGSKCTLCNNTLEGCKICENSIYCSECIKGYFMDQDSNEYGVVSYGQCLKCNENCLTCNEKSTFCTSCRAEFSLTTSRVCMPQNQFNFTMLLSLDMSTFASKINDFKSALVKLISDPTVSADQRGNYLQITKITSGSVKVQGVMTASSPAAIEQTKQNFDTVVAVGSSFAGIPVLSSGATPIQYQSPQAQPAVPAAESIIPQNLLPSELNAGAIIGIAIGVVLLVLLTAGALFYVFYLRKKNRIQIGGNLSENGEKKSTSTNDDLFVIESIIQESGMTIHHSYLEKESKSQPPEYFCK